MYTMFIFIIISFTAISCATTEKALVPRYSINLDVSPKQRFAQICKDFGEQLPEFQKIATRYIPGEYIHLVEEIAAMIDNFISQPFADEIRGFSETCNMSLGEVVLINLIYEATAFCTSVVVQDPSRKILHGRNLDFLYVDYVRNLTFWADFEKKGRIVYSGVMFAGYMGILTGQRPHSFTISIDERRQGFWWENAFEAIFNRKAKIISFLTREVLGTEGVDFRQAVNTLANTSLIAPVYFIVGGTNPGEGVIITRGRESVDVWSLGSEKKRWYLVETNYDHWTTPPPEDNRRQVAEKALDMTGQSNISADTLAKVLSVHPVLNNNTAFTTIMSASDPDLFHSYFP